ncbi:MAG: amidohydrolase [Spirochaetaceae bacterium]|jgi:5-methylthioadenosine/S-adenosylhomocysteine deaminase|nr:amidohydrolase [Spirochaetaceae bacterium]
MNNTCDLLIQNCGLLGDDLKLRENCVVAVAEGKIAAAGPAAGNTAWQGKTTFDAAGKLLLPGFVDGHTHVCQQLLRGRTTDEYPMIWTRFLVPFESSLRPEDVTVSTRLACLEMLKAGITTFADAGGVHMDRAAEAVAESGMRAALCRSTMDTGAAIPASMKESPEDHLRHTEELYRAYHGSAGGRVAIWFGLRQVMTCSPRLIRESAEGARQYRTGLHAHLCEHKDEVSFCLQHYQKRPAAFLDDMGALGPNLLTAHNVMLSEGDITLLAKRGVKIIHCPQANFANHGFPKVPRILEAGLSVGIGNDGASSVALDMFEQLRVLKNGTLAYWGLPVFDPLVLPTAALLRMASPGGAEALGLGDRLGTISPGREADLILLDLRQPHLYPSQNPAHTLIACASGRDVTDVFIGGKPVMRDRRVLTLDEEKILADSARQMAAIVRRADI